MLDAIILSDIHLGSENCQAKLVCEMFEKIVDGEILTKKLILNGDVFDSIDFRRLNKNHWKVLSLIRKLSDHLDIIWLCGNHDGSAEIVSHLLGVTVMNEFILESGEDRIFILHGHVFDEFLDAHPMVTWLADRVYNFLQWVDKTHYFAKLAKRGSKTFLRCTQKIQERAIEMARKKNCQIVCCGHTHLAIEFKEDPVYYYNSGCWTELPCHYLTIASGMVQVHSYQSEAVVSDPILVPVKPLAASAV